MKTKRTHKNGYVLLLTLILLALAAAAMTGVCLRSFAKAVEAVRSQERLQARWGEISCRAAFTPRIESILERQEGITHIACPVASEDVVLNKMTFRVIFTDEQAKVNVNAIFKTQGAEAMTNLVKQLADQPESHPTVELRPSKAPALPFSSFGQVFLQDSPRKYAGEGQAPGIARSITCWGPDRINFHRAMPTTLNALSTMGISSDDLRELVRTRDEQPLLTLEQAMNALDWKVDARILARKLLTDESHCHGLWILPPERIGGETFTIDPGTGSPITLSW